MVYALSRPALTPSFAAVEPLPGIHRSGRRLPAARDPRQASRREGGEPGRRRAHGRSRPPHRHGRRSSIRSRDPGRLGADDPAGPIDDPDRGRSVRGDARGRDATVGRSRSVREGDGCGGQRRHDPARTSHDDLPDDASGVVQQSDPPAAPAVPVDPQRRPVRRGRRARADQRAAVVDRLSGSWVAATLAEAAPPAVRELGRDGESLGPDSGRSRRRRARDRRRELGVRTSRGGRRYGRSRRLGVDALDRGVRGCNCVRADGRIRSNRSRCRCAHRDVSHAPDLNARADEQRERGGRVVRALRLSAGDHLDLARCHLASGDLHVAGERGDGSRRDDVALDRCCTRPAGARPYRRRPTARRPPLQRRRRSTSSPRWPVTSVLLLRRSRRRASRPRRTPSGRSGPRRSLRAPTTM